MLIRNDTYTIYDGIEVELDSNHDSTYTLRHRGPTCSSELFKPSNAVPGLFKLIVKDEAVKNAFSVTTYAQYFGHQWQVDRKEGDALRLSIGHKVDVPDLKMIDPGWYEIWVNKNKIEKIWEERSESGYPFPFPEGLSRTQLLDISSL